MPRIVLRNYKVHYQQTGSGPDLVLIHGLSCNIAFWWFNVAQHLAHRFRVTAVDLRGHGFSGMTETGYRAIDLSDDLAALMEHLHIASAHLVAHSFGGAVATALAAERPDLVTELTLADAWIPSLQPVPPIQGSSDWAATRARAQARKIEIDPMLPLVVRGLYSELLDEIDFIAEGHDEHQVNGGSNSWELERPAQQVRGGAPGPSVAEWWSSRFGRGIKGASGAAQGGGSSAGEPGDRAMPRIGRMFGRGGAAGAGPMVHLNANMHAPGHSPGIRSGDAASREARRKALEGALMMTGAPGQPSQGVKRWHELMHQTRARTEFLDPTAIDPLAIRGIKAHVDLVYGARSRYRPSAEALQELLPLAKLRIIPNAGHYFPLLRHQALLGALGEGLASASEHDGPQSGADAGTRPRRIRLVASQNEIPLPMPAVPEVADMAMSSKSGLPLDE